jgi:hypothetical protein
MVPVPEYDDTSDGSKYNIKLFDDVGVGVGVGVIVTSGPPFLAKTLIIIYIFFNKYS